MAAEPVVIRITSDDVHYLHNRQWPYGRGIARGQERSMKRIGLHTFVFDLKYHGEITINLDPNQYEVVA